MKVFPEFMRLKRENYGGHCNMKKKKRLFLTCILTMFIILGLCSAQAAVKLTGKVKDVDVDEQSLVVGDSNGDIIVYLESSSKIKMGSQAKSLKDIKVGSVIEVSYIKTGEEKVVQTILLSP